MRFGLIITDMRVSQTSSNNCYKLLDDGADWLKSNSITMKTEDHGKKKKAQQPRGRIPLHNQSLRWNVLPRLPGPDRVYDMDFLKKRQIVLQIDIAFFRLRGKTAVGCVENAGENNSWFTVFTLSMTASIRKTVLWSKTHMGVAPPPPPPEL